MKIGVVSDLTGAADICAPVADLGTLQARAYLAPEETPLFALASPKEEYAFTNVGIVTVCGDSAVSTKRMVLRYEYALEPIRHVRFETCGVTDRDCELKFAMGAKEFSIDIAKAEIAAGQRFYRVLQGISRAQQEHARSWDLAKLALDASVRSTTAPDPTGRVLIEQANAVHAWYLDLFARTNPRCYRAVIEAALQQQGVAS